MHQLVPHKYKSSIGHIDEKKRLIIPGFRPELPYYWVYPREDDNEIIKLRPMKLKRQEIPYDPANMGTTTTHLPKYTTKRSFSSKSLPSLQTKPATWETSTRFKCLSMPNAYTVHNQIPSIRKGQYGGSMRSKSYDNTYPILTRIPCDPPTEFIKKLEKNEEGSALLHLLESQKQELSNLADDYRQMHALEQADELSILADRGAYSIALFNRRQQQRKPIPYCFEWIDLPHYNINTSVPRDVLEVDPLRGLNYRRPFDASGALSTFVQLELLYPSRRHSQRIRSDWVKHCEEFVNYPSSLKFKINSLSREYAEFLNSENQLQVTVFYARKRTKRSGTLGSVRFTIRELLHFATVSLSGDLIGNDGEITGQLEMKLKQNQSVKGKIVNVVRKPWLFLTVPEISLNGTSQSLSGFPTNLTLPQSVVHREPLINQDKSAGTLSDEIINSLETAIIYDRDHATKLSTVVEKMNTFYSQIRRNQVDRKDVHAYQRNIQRLLQTFRQKRQEAEQNVDQKTARFYSRRERLTINELKRYEEYPSTDENENFPKLNVRKYCNLKDNRQNNENPSIYSRAKSLQICNMNGNQKNSSEPVYISPSSKDIINVNSEDSFDLPTTSSKQLSGTSEETSSFFKQTAIFLDCKRIGKHERTNSMTSDSGERIIYV